MNQFDLNSLHRKKNQERWREKHVSKNPRKLTRKLTKKPRKIPVKKIAARATNRLFGASSIFSAILTFIGEKIAERVIEEPEILFLIPEFLADVIMFLGRLSHGWQVFIYASAFIWILITIAHKLVMKEWNS